jgi:hypothetical protein
MKILTLRVYLALAVFIFLLAFVLNITAINENSFWDDETFTATTIQMIESGQTFFEAMKIERIHMPLYFTSLLTYPGNHSPFSLRFPSVLWGLLTVAMIMRVLSHLYGLQRYALLAGFIIAIQSYFIFHSRTARMYSMVNFLIITLSYLFFRYINSPQDDQPNVYRFIFYIMSMVAYLTHLATLMLIPAQILVLGWLTIKRQISLRTMLHWVILQLLILIPVLLWFRFGFNSDKDGLAWLSPTTTDHIMLALNTLFIGWVTDKNFVWYMVIITPAIMSFFVFFRRIKYAGYWIGLTIIPFVGLLIVSLYRPLFHERYLFSALFAYVIILILGYKALDDFLTTRFKRIGKVMMWLIIGLHLMNIALPTATHFQSDYFASNHAKYGIEYVQNEARGGDRVVTSYWKSIATYYLDSSKFWYIVDTYGFYRDFGETQTMPADRVWIVTENDHFLQELAEEYDFEAVYEYGGVTVYFIETNN